MSGIMWLAADERPALDAMPVAALPVGVLRFKRKAGLKDEVHDSLILKADGNGVVLTGGKEFNIVQRFALSFFKAMEAATLITANSGLTAPDDDGSGQGRKPSSFAGFAGGLRAAGRAFTFNGSHVASVLGDLVRARSVLITPDAARL